MSDIPPLLQTQIICSISAAIRYQIPASILLAIAEKEGGKPGQWVRNHNGTYDVGSLQFNTAYLRTLAKYGITADDVAVAGCYPFYLAAWRIQGHIQHDQGDIWTRAANYHSRTYKYNRVYRADLIYKAAKWEKWLETRRNTIDLTQEAASMKPVNTSGKIHPNRGDVSSGYVPRTITAR